MLEREDVERVESFFQTRVGGSIFVGIDPGASGAVSLLCEQDCLVFDIPTVSIPVRRTKKLSAKVRQETGKKTKSSVGNKTVVDYVSLHNMMDLFFLHIKRTDNLVVTVVLEKIPIKASPGPLRTADVELYGHWAMWPLYLTSLRVRMLEPMPQTWQKEFGLRGKSKSKDASRILACKLFPQLQSSLSRAKDHDRADAVLLAEFGRRQK